MSAKHTPGPWTLLPTEVGTSYLRIRGSRPGTRYKVANVMAPDYMPEDAVETEANARLIAAAPELLAACQAQHNAIDWLMACLIELTHHKSGIEPFMPSKSPVWPMLVQGNEAIKKATGSAA